MTNGDHFKRDAGQALFELAKQYDLDLESALKRITEADARVLGVERVSIWLFNEDHGEIVCEDLFALSRGNHEKGQRLSAARYPRYFRALEDSRLVDARDAQRDPRTDEFTEGYLKPLGIVSMLDVPIRLHGGVMGVVCHEHVGTLPRPWAPEEKEFTASIADLVSLALEAEERRKLERESEKNLSLLRATLESTADGILVVDRSGRMVSYNRQFVEMWRIPENVIGTGDDEQALAYVLEQVKEPTVFLAKVRELYAKPDAESFDVLEFKDGRVFERYSKPQRVGGAQGESVGRVWSFRDVTARRRAEEVKTIFASMVSHELKTPLAAIQESVGVILDGLDGPVSPAQQKTLQIAKINVEWLGRLINNFLTFTRIESGKMAMQRGRLDARSLVEEAFRLMKPAADKKGLDFVKFLPPERVDVQWDADKMKAVTINLIDNAVKYTDAPGRVCVRLEREGNGVRIEVEDTGMGIREEDKDLIFDMFAQSEARGLLKTGGFGIGLAICKYVVERHRGSLSVESEAGKGSRFVVKMPLNGELPP